MKQDVTLGISTVMAGQELTDVNTGAKTVAVVDMVMLHALRGDQQILSVQLQVGPAMDLARALSTASATILAAGVDDDGQPLSLSARINILTGGTP